MTIFPSIVPETPWNSDDAGNLSSFIKTPTGQRLWGVFQSRGLALNEQCIDGGEPVAFARGYRFSLNLLISLATAQSGTTEQSAHNNGAADPLEHLRP